MVRIEVLVYGSKCVCDVSVRGANSDMGLCVGLFMCRVNEWFGSSRGISLWVEIFLLGISKESE